MPVRDSNYYLNQMNRVEDLIESYSGISDGDRTEHDGSRIEFGDKITNLEKEYNFWKRLYEKQLLEEGKSDRANFKYIKGYEV